MNWAKGRKTRGRGSSFKGALTYALHDKDAATSERVGFVELANLATDTPDRAWAEMMALCDAADALKRRAGVRASGRKLTKPVYAFSLNWHEDDRPEAAHMLETARAALKALGMENLQAVLIEHCDRPHRHVHVIVNLVDPDTGKTVSLSNDEHKLDRWADDYERAQGVIRSPERRAKFAALDQGREPPQRPKQATSREEWEATRRARSQEAKEKIAAIKAGYAQRVAELKATQANRLRLRRGESDQLWTGYQADRTAIRARYQPFIDAIFRSRRQAPPHPHTEQALRDLQDSAEWQELGRRQFKQRRRFNARERHSLGVIANVIRLHFANQGRAGIGSLFLLAVSRKRRRVAFDALQQTEKLALRQSQFQRRKARADILRAACRHELAESAADYRRQRQLLNDRHAGEQAADRAEWRQLAAERNQAWADFRRAFNRPGPQPEADRPSSLRDQFRDAANGAERPGGRTEKTGKAGDGRGSGSSTHDGGPKQQNPGWKARRKAADRKADGSYKPRDRGGRGRRHDR